MRCDKSHFKSGLNFNKSLVEMTLGPGYDTRYLMVDVN